MTRKTEIKKEALFDHMRGTSLLFEARAGSLRTRTFRSKYKANDATCSVCGNDSETMNHLECKGLNHSPEEGSNISRALGLCDEDGWVDVDEVAKIRLRLDHWLKRARKN